MCFFKKQNKKQSTFPRLVCTKKVLVMIWKDREGTGCVCVGGEGVATLSSQINLDLCGTHTHIHRSCPSLPYQRSRRRPARSCVSASQVKRPSRESQRTRRRLLRAEPLARDLPFLRPSIKSSVFVMRRGEDRRGEEGCNYLY